MRSPTFARDGAERFPQILTQAGLAELRTAADISLRGGPGARVNDSNLSALIGESGEIGRIACGCLGGVARPVRTVMFDKTPTANWAVAWHQDRTIIVRERLETPGFGPWSRKAGALHVEPPTDVLAGMATLRIHLDDSEADNAPLMVALGSHHLGRVPASDAADAASRHVQHVCNAAAGDVWAYATLILHGTGGAAFPSARAAC
jgi:hypothetical protein